MKQTLSITPPNTHDKNLMSEVKGKVGELVEIPCPLNLK